MNINGKDRGRNIICNERERESIAMTGERPFIVMKEEGTSIVRTGKDRPL
jgi:hypothetical protein